MQTIEQLRAEHALKCIESDDTKNHQKEYLSYVKALPANILQSGLGQAMAMELAADKGNNGAHKILYTHLEAWLCKENHSRSPYFGANELVKAIIDNNQAKYIQAQTEAMAYLEWLKKFAVAYLKGN